MASFTGYEPKTLTPLPDDALSHADTAPLQTHPATPNLEDNSLPAAGNRVRVPLQSNLPGSSTIAAGNRAQTGAVSGLEAAEHAVADEDSLARDLSMLSVEDFIAEPSGPQDSENDRLKARVAALEAALEKSQLDAKNLARKARADTQEQAKKALQFQLDDFGRKAALYMQEGREICHAEVAQARATLESDAFAAISERDGNISELKASLSYAEAVANAENQQLQNLVAEARGYIQDEHRRAEYSEKLAVENLKTQAEAAHAAKLLEREQQIRAEAESLFASRQAETQNLLETALCKQRRADNLVEELRAEIRELTEKLAIAGGNLTRSQEEYATCEDELFQLMETEIQNKKKIDDLTLQVETLSKQVYAKQPSTPTAADRNMHRELLERISKLDL